MIGEDDPGVDAEGARGADQMDHLPQRVDLRHEQIRPMIAQVTLRKVPPGTRLRRYSGVERLSPAFEYGGMHCAFPPYAC